MNKWEESITNSSDKRKLLIESSEFVSKIKLSKDLKESLIMQSGKAGTLIVKNIPVTILDRENLNGRIYSTETMRQAIEEAREAMRDKQTLGQANEHPESSFVAPTDASHVIINAYIKENIAIVVDGKKERHNVLFTDWEVLNTTHGKDLRALFEAECSFGTSIRGVGELSGKMVENYSFISVDGVGNPSSSTYTRMPVSESVKVEFKDANELKENYTVMSSSTNVVRDLSQAGVLQQQLNANPYGTITKTSTKVDQETDPKTGAQTSITTVEADTEDEVSDLAQAFEMAHKAMTNGISKVNSVTIEANEDEDEQGNKKESVEVDTGLEGYVPESAPMEENAQEKIDNQYRYIISFLNPKDAYRMRAEKIRDDYKNGGLSELDTLTQLNIPYNYAKQVAARNDNVKESFDKQDVMKELNELYAIDKSTLSQEEIENLESRIEQLEGELRYENLVNDESVMTESAKKEEQKDPNEGRQYILKIKDSDPEIKEGSDDAPEFVAMKGNAIRFTKDPKKALHFTQGMEESGIVHYSNIQKLLADMGYGDQNLEKWYKKEDAEGGIVGAIAGGVIGNVVGGPSGAISGANNGYDLGSKIANDLKDSNNTQLTEDGNTKYSASITITNKGGLPETKSLAISSNDLDGALKEISNHWQQQQNSNDVKEVKDILLVDNQSGERFNYDPQSNQLIPENGNQQQVQSIEKPVDNNVTFSEPEQADLSLAAESADGEIEQNDNKLDMDIDDNTHVEKEFDTTAQASVAKSALEQGKVDGSVMLTDAAEYDFENDPKVYNQGRDEIDDGQEPDYERIANSVEYIAKKVNCSLEDAMDIYSKVTGYSFDKDEKEELRDIAPGWYVAHESIGVSGPYETREACMEGLEDFAEEVSVYEVTESDLNEVLFKEPSEPSDDYIQEPEEESVVESSLIPVRFSNIKWDEKDVAYRMFEDIEKDMQVSHIEPDVNNANVLVEYFENYMNDLKNIPVTYNVDPTNIKESTNYQEEIIRMYNEDETRKYPKIESADINLG